MVAPPIDPDLEPSNWWRPIIDYPSFRIALPRSMIKSNRELLWLKQDLIELEEYWQQIDCPVVLMHGSDDRLVPVENVDYGRRVLPGETIVDTLGGEGHFILWTHVDQVVRHIEGLLTEAQ
jgi:pimeloyl-ACP methyl ester carboxylesterase